MKRKALALVGLRINQNIESGSYLHVDDTAGSSKYHKIIENLPYMLNWMQEIISLMKKSYLIATLGATILAVRILTFGALSPSFSRLKLKAQENSPMSLMEPSPFVSKIVHKWLWDFINKTLMLPLLLIVIISVLSFSIPVAKTTKTGRSGI